MLAAVFLMDVRTCALCGYQFLRCAVRVLGCVVFYPTWGTVHCGCCQPLTHTLRCAWHLLLIQCYTCDVLCTCLDITTSWHILARRSSCKDVPVVVVYTADNFFLFNILNKKYEF